MAKKKRTRSKMKRVKRVKRSLKRRSFKNTKRTKRTKITKRKKTKRKRRTQINRRTKRMTGGMEDQLGVAGGAAGGTAEEVVTGGIVRIGFELEGCVKSKDDIVFGPPPRGGDRQAYHYTIPCLEPHKKDVPVSDRRAREPFTLDYFGDLQYFDLVYDGSIECKEGYCSLEIVSTEIGLLTYDGNIFHFDSESINEKLITELAKILTYMDKCDGPRCGFHVHMSPMSDHTMADQTYNLKTINGKLLLLNVLLLWCGTDDTEGRDSYQNKFFQLGYLREDSGGYALMTKKDGLNLDKFKSIYHSVSTSGDKTGEKLTEFLYDFLKYVAIDAGLHDSVARISALHFYGLVELFTACGTWLNDPRPPESKDSAFKNSFDKVLRIEFRGCESILDRLDPAEDSTDKAVSLMSQINQYVHSLYLFFEHAKMLTAEQVLQLEATGTVPEILVPKV